MKFEIESITKKTIGDLAVGEIAITKNMTVKQHVVTHIGGGVIVMLDCPEYDTSSYPGLFNVEVEILPKGTKITLTV